MEEKLTPQNFSKIFKEFMPNLIAEIPKKSFEHCIKDFNLPYLSLEEKNCIKEYTNKYMFSMDYSLIYFSKKLI